jgi:replicative DNA helicase
VTQLKRPPEKDPNKRPELHDLKESGAIEQDAYMVIFVYANPNTGGELPDNQSTIIEVAANRGGRTGSITKIYEKSKQRFVS